MVSTKLRLIEVGSLVWLATAIGGDCFPGAVFATISRHFVVGTRYRAFAHLSKGYTLNKSCLALSSTRFCCMGLERSRKRGLRQRLGPTHYNMQILRPEHASKQSSLNVRNTSTAYCGEACCSNFAEPGGCVRDSHYRSTETRRNIFASTRTIFDDYTFIANNDRLQVLN